MEVKSICLDYKKSLWREFRRYLDYIPGFFRFRIWLKYRLFPMNVIKVKTLGRGWVDRSEIIVHVVFQVLDDFIEKEVKNSHVDWEEPYTDEQLQKLLEIHKWFKEVYLNFNPYKDFDSSKSVPFEEKFIPVDENCKLFTINTNEYEREFFEKVRKQEEELETQLQQNIKTLFEMRDFLWT